jgi:hypothetical protein
MTTLALSNRPSRLPLPRTVFDVRSQANSTDLNILPRPLAPVHLMLFTEIRSPLRSSTTSSRPTCRLSTLRF